MAKAVDANIVSTLEVHDADVRLLECTWPMISDAIPAVRPGLGLLVVRVRLEINPEANFEPFAALGIASRLLEIVFDDVSEMRVRMVRVALEGVILDSWDIVGTWIEPSRFHGVTDLPEAPDEHHRLILISGSVVEIRCKTVKLEEVSVK